MRRMKGKEKKFGKNQPEELYYAILDKELGPPKKNDNDSQFLCNRVLEFDAYSLSLYHKILF